MQNKWFSLYSKLCFICSVVFFVFVLLAKLHVGVDVNYYSLAGFIITLAFLSFILNFIAAAVLLFFLVKKEPIAAPVWVTYVNVFTFLFQMFYFLF